jgi:cyclase
MRTEIAAGVFYESGYEGGNVGYISTALGGLLVDSPPLPHRTREWQAQVLEMQPLPLYGLVNTDCHLERMLGNSIFAGLRTFGHESSAKPISKYSATVLEQFAGRFRDLPVGVAEEIVAAVLRVPEISVQDRLVIHAPDREVHIIHFEGHTPGSLGVYLPAERVLFAGDTVTHREPPALAQANTLAWLEAIKRIEALEIDVIVPAAGDACGKEALAPLAAYIDEMWRLTAELFEAGASRRECVEKVALSEHYAVPKGQETRMKRRRRESIERVYTEIRLAQRRRRS